MKTRIISKLRLFASEDPAASEDSMFNDICNELSISGTELQQKSKTVLQKILHNYGAFEISTIDGFTHRVIRTFAMDLKLPTNFEVELDQDYMLNKAVDNLIAKAGTKTKLTKTLVDFVIEKADDDKSWDISRDFFDIGKLLLNEKDLDHIAELKNKTLEDFERLKKGLRASIRELESTTITIGETVLTFIDEVGLEHSDFDRRFLPNYFINLSNGKFNLNFTLLWQKKLLDGERLYPKRVSDDIGEIINAIQPQIAEYFSSTKDLINEIKLNKAILKNVTPLSVLSALQKELNLLKLDENKVLISEFNSIISDEIKEQPTPFIYERLGEKFRHYFIDEFQDTSQMQWENLIPLIDNSLSSADGSTMLVGDAKQSIYRWRGANVNQFIDLYQGRTNIFQTPLSQKSLQENYRSAKEIVAFNNSFFSYIAQNFFSNSDYSGLYNDANQNITSEQDGFVNISFIEYQDIDEATESYCHETYLKILECQKQSYRLNDICILVRKKKEGNAISDYLTSRGIPIISSETLLLENSPKIKLINALLELLINPENANLKLKFLSNITSLLEIENTHDFLELYLHLTTPDILQKLKEYSVELNYKTLIKLPLYEIAESIVIGCNLWNNSSDAFLQFYLDVILDFSNKQPSDIMEFLEYFDTKKDTFSVSVPKDLNAVSIMTIHKSKGLEFPVVIFPFADFSIYDDRKGKLWFPLDKEKYFGFDEALLNSKSEIADYGDIGEYIHTQNKSQLELDAINLLYVTLTRAEEQLYIIPKANISANERSDYKSIAALIIRYLENKNMWREGLLEYSFGESQKKEHALVEDIHDEHFAFESVAKENHNLNIVTKNGSLWGTDQQKAILYGNLLHLIMSKIETISDLDSASEFLRTLNAVNSEKCEELIRDAKRIVEHPELSKYFSNDIEVYNEKEIITSNGEFVRPDRLVIKDERLTVIDYKTGSSDKKHNDQINFYANVLKEMNFQIEKKLLIYTNEDLKIVEVM